MTGSTGKNKIVCISSHQTHHIATEQHDQNRNCQSRTRRKVETSDYKFVILSVRKTETTYATVEYS